MAYYGFRTNLFLFRLLPVGCRLTSKDWSFEKAKARRHRHRPQKFGCLWSETRDRFWQIFGPFHVGRPRSQRTHRQSQRDVLPIRGCWGFARAFWQAHCPVPVLFLVLFGDKDYSKVLDSLSKVDKALRVKQSATVAATPSATQSTTTHRNSQPMVCFFCGSPGHIATFCYKKRAQQSRNRGRFTPYPPQRGRGRGGRM